MRVVPGSAQRVCVEFGIGIQMASAYSKVSRVGLSKNVPVTRVVDTKMMVTITR